MIPADAPHNGMLETAVGRGMHRATELTVCNPMRRFNCYRSRIPSSIEVTHAR
ncbi:hypothetical protein AMB3_2283 [plant metagenome]